MSNNHLSFNRRGFLKAGLFLGLPLISFSLFSIEKKSISTFTRVSSSSPMSSAQFNALKPLWIDSRLFSDAILNFQKSGLILSHSFSHSSDSTFVEFVFISKNAKYEFDDYLVKNKIFCEQKLIELGLIHETGIS